MGRCLRSPGLAPEGPNRLNQSCPLDIEVSQSGNPVVIFRPVVVGEGRRGSAMPVIVLIASTLIFWLIYWFVRMDGVDQIREHIRQRKDACRRASRSGLRRYPPSTRSDRPSATQ